MTPHLTPGYYSKAVLLSSGDVILVPEKEMHRGEIEKNLIQCRKFSSILEISLLEFEWKMNPTLQW